MNMIRPEEHTSPGEIHRKSNRLAGFFLHFLLPLAILACGVVITIYLLKTSPEARPGIRPPTATLVEVRQVQAGRQQTLVEAMGEIVPAREIELKPRVSGEIVEVSPEFLPGGNFQADQTMLRIDPADYSLALKQLESAVQQAESDLAVEMGNQRIAEKEFTLLKEAVSSEERSLILRQPQLTRLQAALASAQAKLAQARLDLDRTEIKSPFNGVVQNRNADVGTKVNESTVLAGLVGTDAFWLRLTLPVEQLRWLEIPAAGGEAGSEVRIYPQSGAGADRFRTGRIIRLEPSLESQGRMAQLLVQIDDPLCLRKENADRPKLLLGSFVRAEIIGVSIDKGVALDRSHLHEGNKVWLMDDQGRLEIREVEILFRSRDQVVVNGSLRDGERLVVSQLASPIAGTPLRLAGEEPAEQLSMQGATPKQQETAGGQRSVE